MALTDFFSTVWSTWKISTGKRIQNHQKMAFEGNAYDRPTALSQKEMEKNPFERDAPVDADAIDALSANSRAFFSPLFFPTLIRIGFGLFPRFYRLARPQHIGFIPLLPLFLLLLLLLSLYPASMKKEKENKSIGLLQATTVAFDSLWSHLYFDHAAPYFPF